MMVVKMKLIIFGGGTDFFTMFGGKAKFVFCKNIIKGELFFKK